MGWLILEGDGPELFGNKVFDLIVAVDDEAEGGELTGAIAHYVVVLAI